MRRGLGLLILCSPGILAVPLVDLTQVQFGSPLKYPAQINSDNVAIQLNRITEEAINSIQPIDLSSVSVHKTANGQFQKRAGAPNVKLKYSAKGQAEVRSLRLRAWGGFRMAPEIAKANPGMSPQVAATVMASGITTTYQNWIKAANEVEFSKSHPIVALGPADTALIGVEFETEPTLPLRSIAELLRHCSTFFLLAGYHVTLQGSDNGAVHDEPGSPGDPSNPQPAKPITPRPGDTSESGGNGNGAVPNGNGSHDKEGHGSDQGERWMGVKPEDWDDGLPWKRAADTGAVFACQAPMRVRGLITDVPPIDGKNMRVIGCGNGDLEAWRGKQINLPRHSYDIGTPQ